MRTSAEQTEQLWRHETGPGMRSMQRGAVQITDAVSRGHPSASGAPDTALASGRQQMGSQQAFKGKLGVCRRYNAETCADSLMCGA